MSRMLPKIGRKKISITAAQEVRHMAMLSLLYCVYWLLPCPFLDQYHQYYHVTPGIFDLLTSVQIEYIFRLRNWRFRVSSPLSRLESALRLTSFGAVNAVQQNSPNEFRPHHCIISGNY